MERVVHSDLPEDFVLRLTSDWQVGATGSSSGIIDRILAPVKAKSNYRVALLGDLLDAITTKDRRFSWEDLDAEVPTPMDQAVYVVDKLRPLKEKILSFGSGNHELAVRSDGDPTRLMIALLAGPCDERYCTRRTFCEKPEHRKRSTLVPYGGYTALVEINDESKLLLWHGRPSIRSTLIDPLQRTLALKRRLVAVNKNRWGDCHLVAQGHTNQLIVVRPEETRQLTMSWADGDIVSSYPVTDHKWYVNCGSAQKLFIPGKTTYAEAAGYHPLPLGCVDVYFEDSRIVDVREVVLG